MTHKCIHPYPATEKCPAECVARDRDHSLEEAHQTTVESKGSSKGTHFEGDQTMEMYKLCFYTLMCKKNMSLHINV